MEPGPLRVLGRYALYGEIASGGMATVHFGRLLGPVGFSRTVAIKRLHPQFAKDPDFVSMFLDEARLAARIQHPNVVATLDVVAVDDELFLVMEYVEGESLARILRAARASGARLPPRVVGAIMSGALYGLHAAHEAKNERGEPLSLVHRDVSPQNVLVGLDGVARVLDFGIAKATGRSQATRDGQIKGKLAYMPPEQIQGEEIDRRVDVYAAGVVLWEALTSQRLFDGENEGAILAKILKGATVPPSQIVPGLSPAVDDVVLAALSKDPAGRFGSTWDMAVALEDTLGMDTPRKVGEYVEASAREAIARRTARVKQLESLPTDLSAMVTASSVLGVRLADEPTPRGSGKDDRTVRRRSSRSVLLALGLMAGLGAATALGILALLGVGRDPPLTSTARSEERRAGEPPAPSRAADGPASADPADPAAPDPTPGGGAEVAGSAASPASSPASSAAPPRPAPAGPSKALPTSPPKPAPDCRPPYVIVDGIRKLKPECI